MADAGAGTLPGIRSVSRIDDIDPAAWNRLAGDNPLLAHGWLRTMEDEWPEPVERRYLLVENAGRLLAAAACYVDKANAIAESVDDLLFGRLRSLLPGRLPSIRPALVCGYPWSPGSGCMTSADLEGAARAALVDSLVDAVTEEAERLRYSALFLSVTEAETSLVARLRAHGYLAARHEPIYVLDVDWPDFEAYRRGLPSLNIRKNIRREQNRNRKAGVVIDELPAPSASEERLHEIVDRHFRRYGWPAFPYGPGWFSTLKANLGGDAVISCARQGDRAIGVAVSVRKGGTRYLVLVCIDHEQAGNDFTHFNLAYYRGLADCMGAGDRRYCVGPGQGLSRRRRGYRPLGSYVFCRPRGWRQWALLKLWMPLLSAWLRRKEN